MDKNDDTRRESEGHDGPFPMKTLNPERITFTNLYQGSSGPDKATDERVQSAHQLQQVMPDLMNLLSQGTTIDWNTEDVILVGLGEKKTSGWRVEIRHILYLEDREQGHPNLTMVYYCQTEPSGITNDVITRPVHVIKLQKLKAKSNSTQRRSCK